MSSVSTQSLPSHRRTWNRRPERSQIIRNHPYPKHILIFPVSCLQKHFGRCVPRGTGDLGLNLGVIILITIWIIQPLIQDLQRHPGEVGRRANQPSSVWNPPPRLGHSSGTYLGNPKIDQYDILYRCVFRTVQEVIGFDIPMYNPMTMDKSQGILYSPQIQ
jgi:hypothetical protein